MQNLIAALEAEGLEAEIHLVNVTDNQEAARLRFLGSPSFQMNGVDLWNEAREGYDLSCRLYSTPDGMKGAPTIEMLRKKLYAMRDQLI